MSRLMSLRGSGGGGKDSGGSGRLAQESADSLRSTSFARVLDLICEGEIEGLVNGPRSVYLDGTPLQNEDGTFNFSDVSVDLVTGTQHQDPFPGMVNTEVPVPVGVEVLQASPVTRTITNPGVDAARVNVFFPSLTEQNTQTGDLNGTSVQIQISVQSNGGGFVAQPIGREWLPSVNPAVLPATGLAFDVQWQPTLVTDDSDQIFYESITFLIQYRDVGIGTWVTYRSDALTSADLTIQFDELGRQTITVPTRSYQLTGLPESLYEVRLVPSGSGTVELLGLRIFTAVTHDTIAGKSLSGYQRSYRIPLAGSPPWDVRVIRVTPDSVSAAVRNKTVFSSYSEITDEKFSYPNSAVALIKVNASQFQSIPTRAYDAKLLRVQIPSNYNPVSRVYTGIWDGTFTVAWTDNPAWVFYDLLTNARYGLGAAVQPEQVDKWALYTIGKYCDEFVPNGYGVQEPRFTCNVYLQTQAEAFTVISSLASVFRGMAYWAAGSITAVQDAPADPVFLFTDANVENGTFSYTGTAKQARHTVALVSWNDPADGYKLKPEYVEDLDGIARYGIVPTDLTAFGCTSRGQAHRLGRWVLYSERLETESIAFQCGMDGTYLRPGSIFAVQDQHRAGVRYGGRIRGATSTSLTIDSPITLVSGETYSIKVVLPDGTLDTRVLTNGPGSTSVLTVAAPFTQIPLAPSVWMVTSSTLEPRLYRALSITEVDRHKYEVQGIEHNPSKFEFIEQGLELRTPRTSTISTTPASPAGLTVSEALAIRQGLVMSIVTIEWTRVPTAVRYRVEYRRDNGNYVALPDVRATSAELVDAVPGFYEFRVVAINILQVASVPATGSRQIYGKTLPPADVTGFVVARNGETLTFAWQAVPDLDIDHYALRYGSSWSSGVPLGQTRDTRFSVQTNLGGTYLIKAVDTTGNESVTPAAIIIDANTDINVVVTENDAPDWNGVTTQTVVTRTGVTLDGQQTWAELIDPWPSYPESWIRTGAPYLSGTYETVPIDLGVVMTSRVEVLPTVIQDTNSQTWADLPDPWTSYLVPWTGDPTMTHAQYDMALSQDGVTWSPYQTYQAGHYIARAYKFRVTLTTVNPNYLPRLTSFLVTVDVPDRVVHFEDLLTDVGGTTITFSPAFVNVQTVTGTIQGGAIGDTFRVTGKSNTQATITVYDQSGTPKAGSVDLDVFGYGAI